LGLLNGLCYLTVAVLANAAGVVLDGYQVAAVRTATAWVYPLQAYQTIFFGCAGLGLLALLAALRIHEPVAGSVKPSVERIGG
jgi:uncharacterized membrane protein